MPLFSIDEAVFELVPSARFSAVVLRGADNTRQSSEIDTRLTKATEGVRQAFAGQDIKAHPNLAVWREAFGVRGWTPSKYLSSIEALVRRVSRGAEMPRINPAVDLGNSVSLEMLVPIGVHDLGSAREGITVRLAEPGDRFQPMGDDAEESPDPGEIVYASGHDIRTRRWVWRQSRSALVGPAARDVLFAIDGFHPATVDAVHRAADLLANLAPRYLGGTAEIHHLGPDHRSI